MGIQQFVKRNASMILTCIGVAGVIVTAVMAAKETPKALALLEDAVNEKGEDLTKLEKIKIVGPVYIPSVITGAATIACIFGSNIISKRQQAALMSAYALLDNSYKEYKKKTEEIYGTNAGKYIRSEIANDKYKCDNNLLDDNKELFFDFYSGRYFESTKETVILAQYKTNRAMYVNGAVCINDYYELLGLKKEQEYELLGWSCDQIKKIYQHPWIEFEYEKIIIDEESEHSEGMECTIIHLPMEPFMNYF